MVLDALPTGMQQLSVGVAKHLHSDKKHKALPMSARGWPYFKSLSVDWKGRDPLSSVFGHDHMLLQSMEELHLANMSLGRVPGSGETPSDSRHAVRVCSFLMFPAHPRTVRAGKAGKDLLRLGRPRCLTCLSLQDWDIVDINPMSRWLSQAANLKELNIKDLKTSWITAGGRDSDGCPMHLQAELLR